MPNESRDLDEVRESLVRAWRALRISAGSQDAVTALYQAVICLMKRDLIEWGLEPAALSRESQAVRAAVIYSPREPVFRGYLQLLALIAVLEERLAFQENDGGWKAWRRDAQALVNRLERFIDDLSSVPVSGCASA